MAVGTRGRFFRGYSSSTLIGAFNAISSETKIEFQSRCYLRTAELFPWLAAPAIVLLGFAAVAARPMWRPPVLA